MPEPRLEETPSPAPDAPALRDHLLAAAAGLAAALFVLAPIWGAPTRRLVGDWQHADTLPSHHLADWVARRLAGFGGIFHSSATYTPVGEAPLGVADGAAAVLSAPFLVLLGWPLGVNVYLAATGAANAAAAAWLARAAGAGRAPAVLAGVAVAGSPYILNELSAGRLAQVPVWPLLAGLGAWLHHLQAPGRRFGWWTAGFLGIATLQYAWYGFFGVVLMGLLATAQLGGSPQQRKNPGWTRAISTAALGTLVACLPGAALAGIGGPSAAEVKSPQPLSIEYSLPPSWVLGVEGGPATPAALSLVLLGLAVAAGALLRRDWKVQAFIAVGLAGWVFSLGPRMLTAGGPIVDSHLPFYWFFSAPGSSFLYPYQHVLLLTAAVAVLAARGVTAAAARGPRWAEGAMSVALVLAVPAELHARGAPVFAKVSHLRESPPWIAELRALPEGAVVGLPLAPELRVSEEALLLQMLHNHPIVDGRSPWRDDRRPAAWDRFVEEESGFLKEIVRFERGLEVPGDPTRANWFRYPPEDVRRLVEHGVRWVMVWDPLYPSALKALAPAERQLLERLTGKPVLKADGLAVYDLQAVGGTGEVAAPAWRMPRGVRTGDGVRRMAGVMAPGVLFERTATTLP
jgi:hypothetical protein